MKECYLQYHSFFFLSPSMCDIYVCFLFSVKVNCFFLVFPFFQYIRYSAVSPVSAGDIYTTSQRELTFWCHDPGFICLHLFLLPTHLIFLNPYHPHAIFISLVQMTINIQSKSKIKNNFYFQLHQINLELNWFKSMFNFV